MTQDRLATGLIRRRFQESSRVIRATERRLTGRIAEAAGVLTSALRQGGGVMLFGNGGSAADAQHVAGELVGRLLLERKALRAEALSTDTSVLTCIGNDYSFREIFSRQVEARGRPGDVAVAFSTSGNSPNVVAALAKARKMGMATIALTGGGGRRCARHADVLLAVPCKGPSMRIQEAHAVIYHTLCELVEADLAHER